MLRVLFYVISFDRGLIEFFFLEAFLVVLVGIFDLLGRC